MEKLPFNFSEQLNKPVDEIKSEYIHNKIESLEDPRVSELKVIKKLVDVEMSLLDEADIQLNEVIEYEVRRRGMEFSVARGLDNYRYFDGEFEDATQVKDTRNFSKHPRTVKSEMAARAIVEEGIDSDRAEGLVRVEWRQLGEKETRDGFPGNSYSRMIAHFGLSSKDLGRVYTQLYPEEYE